MSKSDALIREITTQDLITKLVREIIADVTSGRGSFSPIMNILDTLSSLCQEALEFDYNETKISNEDTPVTRIFNSVLAKADTISSMKSIKLQLLQVVGL